MSHAISMVIPLWTVHNNMLNRFICPALFAPILTEIPSPIVLYQVITRPRPQPTEDNLLSPFLPIGALPITQDWPKPVVGAISTSVPIILPQLSNLPFHYRREFIHI